MLNFVKLLVLTLVLPLHAQTFFERIDTDQIISFNTLKTEVKAHAALDKTSYLSLGETHSQSNTTHLIAIELIKNFRENIGPGHTSKLCLEELASFYRRADYQAQKELFNIAEIYPDNSPYRTDFKRCAERGVSKYITYSGMFHMFDYTPTFPGEIDTQSLSRTKNNFIAQQMPFKNAMFIAQINLYIAEILANRKLVNEKLTDPIIFKKKVDDLIAARKNLINKFEYLYTGTDTYSSKLGAVVPAKAIQDQKLPENTFFILTDLEYRVKEDFSYLLLKQIKKRSNNEISLMLQTINDYPIFLPASAASMEQQSDETTPVMCYGMEADFCFPFYAQFMEVKLSDRYDLYVALKDELKCYTRQPTVNFITKNGKKAERRYPFIQQDCSEQILLYNK